MQFSSLGYQTLTKEVDLRSNTNLDILMEIESYETPSVELFGNWADKGTPVTHSDITKEEIQKVNLGQDVPYMLKWTPSAVVSSDAGNGIGYTSMRIRGSDPTRINVSLNGVPLNDSESQGVFWVNLPDFLSSVEKIQVQRGVGTSVAGVGSFGANINLNTAGYNPDPQAAINLSAGSFNTQKYNLQVGSGLIKNKFSVQARLSDISSDGYVDRARAELRSYFLSGLCLGEKSSLRFNMFSGKELTQQAWNGLPAQYLEVDSLRTHNTGGTERQGEPHPNEVDDYNQTHYQLLYHRDLNAKWVMKLTGHYTKGNGFFEQYKADEQKADYGLDTLGTTDLIRRRWLDNDFYGALATIAYTSLSDKLDVTLGGGWNRYDGVHFGEVIWARDPGTKEAGYRYYNNDATKMDLNVFTRADYRILDWINIYADLQVRKVDYRYLGVNNDGGALDQNDDLLFFNPKAGMNLLLNKNARLYMGIGVANREPNRDDFTEANEGSRPSHETLYDLELGYSYEKNNLILGVNVFNMIYKNQLVLTGQINDVGAYTRRNVDASYRLGVEASATYRYGSMFVNGDLAISRNRISEMTEYIDNWDTGIQEAITRKDTRLALSPELIAGVQLGYDWLATSKNQSLLSNIAVKYVGEQNIDNSGNTHTALDAFNYTDLNIVYGFKTEKIGEIQLSFMIRNLFDQKYVTSAWAYRYRSASYDARADNAYTRLEEGDTYHQVGFYPQAGINFLLGCTIKI